MPRRPKSSKRTQSPDPIHGSVIMGRFINKLMKDGKKTLARKIFYDALNGAYDELHVTHKDLDSQVECFSEIIHKARPLVHVRSKRIGGATYQVPVQLQVVNGENMAMRWIIEEARKESGSSMSKSLSKLFVDCYNGVGKIIKKREDTHKMAEANRAFAAFGGWA